MVRKGQKNWVIENKRTTGILSLLLGGEANKIARIMNAKTFGFNRNKVRMHKDELLGDFDMLGIYEKFSSSDRYLRKVLSEFDESNLFFFFDRRGKRCKATRMAWCSPNLVGILEVVYCFTPMQKNKEKILQAIAEAKKDYLESELPSDISINLEKLSMMDKHVKDMREQIAKGVQDSKEALRRQRDKRDSRPLEYLTPTLAMVYMQEQCADLGVSFFDERIGKTMGQLKNWLVAIAEAGHDAREVLYDVCQYWNMFRVGEITQDGREVVLPHQVSFSEFYKYRKYILGYIDEQKQNPTPKSYEDGDYTIVDVKVERMNDV